MKGTKVTNVNLVATHEDTLKKHIYIQLNHEGNKDYKCESCGYSCSHAGYLKKHNYTIH